MSEDITPVDQNVPELTLEEQTEQDILLQPDCLEIVKRDENEQRFANIIWTALESETLGKRVTSIYQYNTLTEDDGETQIGRQLVGIIKVIGDFGIDCETNTIQVIGSLKRGE